MGGNDQYRDSVFIMLFKDRDKLRELYEALIGIPLDKDVEITINTLEGRLFGRIKNDVSFLVGGKMVVLAEHQSTINPNMPLRLLQYVNEIYKQLVDHEQLYSQKAITLPRPEFIVIYNGSEKYDEKKTLKLSALFNSAEDLRIDPEQSLHLELTVKVYNINPGYNGPLKSRSKTLSDYCILIGKIQEFSAIRHKGKTRIEAQELREAIEEAVNWCLERGILADFLTKHRGEVTNMLYGEWSLETALKVRGEEGREEGLEEGIEIGREEGRTALLDIARKALAKGLSDEMIRDITGLNIETIKGLREE